MVRGGVPPHPRCIGAEEGGEPGGPTPPASVVDGGIDVIIYEFYTVRGGGGSGGCGVEFTTNKER